MDILVYDHKKGKQVLAGRYDEATFTFYKECERKHWMKIRQGFGISEEAIEKLWKLGCKYVQIKFGKEVRQVIFELWAYVKSEGFGHDKQKFFPWEHMTVVKSDQMELGL